MAEDLYKSEEDLKEETEELETELEKIQEKIDLNKKAESSNKKMVEKDSKEKIKAKKKEEKDRQRQEKREAKIKKIKVMVGEKEYMVPETAIFELSKREYKGIKENKKKIKEGEVCVMYLLESGIADIKYVRPDNGMIIVEGIYYHILEACNYSLGPKRIPLAIIPEWSFIPLSRKNYEKQLGSASQTAQKLIIKSLENAEIVKINRENEPTKKADGKLIIYILIAAVVGIYFLQKLTGGA